MRNSPGAMLTESFGRFASIASALLLAFNLLIHPGCHSKRSGPNTKSEIQQCLWKGDAQLQAGDSKGAITTFGKAIELDSNCITAWVKRAQAREEYGDDSGAAADFSAATRLSPIDAGNFMLRAVAWGRIGENQRALHDYDEAIKQRPGFATAFLLRGLLHRKRGEYDAAIDDLSDVLRYSDDDTEQKSSHDLLAICLLNRGFGNSSTPERFQSAIEDLTLALKHDPTLVDALSYRAAIYKDQGKYELALADLAELIRREPANSSAYHNRSQVFQKTHQWERAISDSLEAVRLDPELWWNLEGLAGAYEGIADYQNAASNLRKAIELAETTPDSWKAQMLSRVKKLESHN